MASMALLRIRKIQSSAVNCLSSHTGSCKQLQLVQLQGQLRYLIPILVASDLQHFFLHTSQHTEFRSRRTDPLITFAKEHGPPKQPRGTACAQPELSKTCCRSDCKVQR